MNMKEPLGIPRGSVRALIALAFTGVSGYLFATGQTLPGELLTLVGAVVAFYFAERSSENMLDTLTEEETPAAPYLGDED